MVVVVVVVVPGPLDILDGDWRPLVAVLAAGLLAEIVRRVAAAGSFLLGVFVDMLAGVW